MSADPNSIVINLDTLESTDVLDRKNLIFQDQFDLLVKKIRRKAKENRDKLENQECRENQKQDDEARGVPSCFFIDGTRGSGKSTLMRAVRDALVNGKYQENEQNKICLYPLADVDPTELGKGENFFLYLLARIYRLLDEYFKKRDLCDNKVGQIRAAMEALRKMSGGLQVLMDSDGALKESDNPDFFLEKCVDKCADSTLLRKKLCELLGAVAKIVGKEIFLVTIDDADLNFSKCEDVLEYVRKYMQTPRLIFLFAGDMHLYSPVVRGMQIRGFEKKLLKYDREHTIRRARMLDHLEEQYLLKLFPAENRLTLGCFVSLLRNSASVKLKFGAKWQEKDEEKLILFLEYYLEQLADQASLPLLKGFLGKLPLRSVLLLLRHWYEASKEPGVEIEKISAGVQQIALQSLIKYGIEYASLQGGDVATLLKNLFHFFSQDISIEKSLSLNPVGEDLGALLVCFYLSALVADATRTMHAKIAYFVTLHPNWETINQLLAKSDSEYSYSESHKRNVIEQQFYFLDSQDYMLWAARASACMAPVVESGNNRKRRYGGGTIRLMKKSQRRNPEKGSVDKISFSQFHRVLSSLDINDNTDIVLCKLAVLNSICELQDGREIGYYLSIYSLLSCAADLLKRGWEVLEKVTIAAKPIEENEEFALWVDMLKPYVCEKITKVDSPPLSVRFSSYSINEEELTSDLEDGRYFYLFSNINDEVITKISQWIVKFSRISQNGSSMLMDKLWVGFESRFLKYESEFSLVYSEPEKQARAGAIFKRYMDAFELALEGSNRDERGDSFKVLSQCIREFPLWSSLKTVLSDEENVFSKLLNSVNIGSLVDMQLVAMVEDARTKLKDAEQRVDVLLKGREEYARNLQAAENAMRPLRAEKARAMKSFNDLERKIEKRNKEISDLDTLLDSLSKVIKETGKQRLVNERLLNDLSVERVKIEKEREKLDKTAAETRENIEQIEKQIVDARNSLNNSKIIRQSKSNEEENKDYKEAEDLAILMLANAEEKERLYKNNLRQLISRQKELDREMQSLQRKQNSLEKELKSQKTLEEKSNKEMVQLQKKKNDARQAVLVAQGERSYLNDQLKNIESRYTMAQKAKLEVQKQIDLAAGAYEQALQEKKEAQKHLDKVRS